MNLGFTDVILLAVLLAIGTGILRLEMRAVRKRLHHQANMLTQHELRIGDLEAWQRTETETSD